MDLHLHDKRALVTGSSSGLGAKIAERLAAEGAGVVVHGRDEARAAAVAAAITDAGGRADAVTGDLGTDAGADAVAGAALAGGPVDILVNNAGAFDVTATWESTGADDWAALYNTNVISAVRAVHRLVPAMRERGWGRVIQISSVTGRLPQATQPHYAATNAARSNLAASLSRELRGTGVTSNAVAAGGILTPSNLEMLTRWGREQGMGETWEEIEPRLVAAHGPNDVGRVGRRAEYADLVAFLASPLSGYVTGANLSVDGGWRDA